ncbi:hypothetical protein VTK56DRAFT_10108 [Thermocarpiscus australiensis]
MKAISVIAFLFAAVAMAAPTPAEREDLEARENVEGATLAKPLFPLERLGRRSNMAWVVINQVYEHHPCFITDASDPLYSALGDS